MVCGLLLFSCDVGLSTSNNNIYIVPTLVGWLTIIIILYVANSLLEMKMLEMQERLTLWGSIMFSVEYHGNYYTLSCNLSKC